MTNSKVVSNSWQCLVRNPIAQSLAIYTVAILLLIWPTLGLYMWSGHDQLYPVIRVYEVCKVWRAQGPGHVPWAPDWAFGYGYPFHTFYPPFGYYVAAIFHFFLGLDYGPATKMSFYSSLYLSGLFMYALVYLIGRREGWPRLAWWALGAATVFALTRYHLTDLFVRDALGESWAWPALAGLFLGAEIARQRRCLGVIIIAVAYTCLILSHNITAVYGTIAIGFYALLTISEKRWPFVVMTGGVLGVSMATFFWLPALTLLKLTNAGLPSRVDVSSTMTPPEVLHLHALYWQQHFVESLGTEGSIPGPNDNMGINLGIAVLIGIVLSAIAFLRPGLNRGQRYRLGLCLALVALALFVMSPKMDWTRVPPILRYIQFPWRLLIFTAFFGCLATTMATPVLDKWLHPLVWSLIAIVLAIPTLPAILTLPGKLTDRGTTDRVLRWYKRMERENWYGGNAPQEFWPLSVKAPLTDPKYIYENPPPANRLNVASGDILVEDYRHEGTAYLYKYTANNNISADVAVIYFPGWELRIDGQKRSNRISMSDKGLVRLELPAGSHTAELKYTLSPIGRLARNISYVGWAAWVSIAISLAQSWRKFRQRKLLAAQLVAV
jgi:hypothetical protein